MDSIDKKIEGLLESIKELREAQRESQAEHDRRLKESQVEHDRLLKKSQAEHDRRIADIERLFKESKDEYEMLFKESKAEDERRKAEYDKQMEALRKEIGGISNSNGEFAEEYFENIYFKDRTFAGMHFHEILRRKKFDDRNRTDEFDIIMLNEQNVVIVETKYKAHESNIKDVIKKAEAFRYWFPEYNDYKIYLCLASLRFEDNIIGKARKNGIAVVQQLGDKTVVNDENLKAY